MNLQLHTVGSLDSVCMVASTLTKAGDGFKSVQLLPHVAELLQAMPQSCCLQPLEFFGGGHLCLQV